MLTYEERINQLKKDLADTIIKTEVALNGVYIRDIHLCFRDDENYQVVRAIAKRDNLPVPEIITQIKAFEKAKGEFIHQLTTLYDIVRYGEIQTDSLLGDEDDEE